MIDDKEERKYFDKLYDLMCDESNDPIVGFRKLFQHLYHTEFVWIIRDDEHRATDGLDLRRRLNALIGNDKPCSVLEMIEALAIRCEESIMDDPKYGDRTRQWFWKMIANLGLGSMTDANYDPAFVNRVIDIFLNREYERNGRGGLFTIVNTRRDLRKVSIWYQLSWYLSAIT